MKAASAVAGVPLRGDGVSGHLRGRGRIRRRRADAQDARALLLRRERGPVDRPGPARSHDGRRRGERRHRQRPRHAGLRQSRVAPHPRPLRLSGLHTRRGPRHDDDDRRSPGRGAHPGAGGRPGHLSEGGERGQERVAPRAVAAQRLQHARRQHPARRPDRGRAEVHRAPGPRGAVSYEFVFPTVVGPRYSSQPAEGAPEQDRFVASPYLPEGVAAKTRFDIQVALDAGVPVRELLCPSHRTRTEWEGTSKAMRSPRSAGERGRQSRLHPALPSRRRAHRVRARPLPGSGRGFLPRHGPAAGARGPVRHPAPRIHLRGRRLRLHDRLPARHREEAAARPDRHAQAHRHLQRPALLRHLPSHVAAVAAGERGQRGRGHPRHRRAARRRRHRAPRGARPRPADPAHRTGSRAASSWSPTATSRPRPTSSASSPRTWGGRTSSPSGSGAASTATSSKAWPAPATASPSWSRARRRPRASPIGSAATSRARCSRSISIAAEGFDAYDLEPAGFPTCSRSARWWRSASGAARPRAAS